MREDQIVRMEVLKEFYEKVPFKRNPAEFTIFETSVLGVLFKKIIQYIRK